MRTLKKSDLQNDPNLLWNEFIDILAMEEYEENDKLIRDASLVFWYESELQNGGHLQYFENRGIENANDTAQALMNIGANEQKKVFEKALAIWESKIRKPIEDVEEYVLEALEGEFEELNSEYFECSQDMNSYLEEYLEKNKHVFFNFE